MYVYAEKIVQRKIHNRSLKETKNVIQKQAQTARDLRTIAIGIRDMYPGPFDTRTAGVSNNRFAITPELGGALQQAAVEGYATPKIYAGPNLGVAQGDQFGNHAERKLIQQDGARTEIGVSRRICNTCLPAICALHGHIQHVADPDDTYQVNQGGLQGLDHGNIRNV